MLPLSVEKTLRKANALVKRGEFDLAAVTFNHILSSFPENTNAKRGLAFAQRKSSEKPQKKLDLLTEKQTLLRLFNEKKFKAVIQKAEFVKYSFPQDRDILNILGVSAAEAGEIKKAKQAFKDLAQLEPKNPINHLNLAKIAKNAHELDECVGHYQKALMIDPTNVDGWYSLGIALQTKHGFKEAIDALEAAISLDPTHVDAHNALGISFRQTGQLTKSISTHNKAIEINPNEPVSQFNLGLSLHKNQQIDEAIEAYQETISLDPLLSEPHYFLGLAFQKRYRTRESIQEFKKVIELEPDYTKTYTALADSYAALELYNEAIEMYKKAIKLNPKDAKSFNDMGLAYNNLNETSKAILAFKTAIRIEPKSAVARNNLGRTYIGMQRFKEGFGLCEWRWKTYQKSEGGGRQTEIGDAFDGDLPKWRGEAGKRLYIWAEQGIGDEIMYASLMSEISGLCKEVTLECDHRLIPLFSKSLSKKIKYQPRNQTRKVLDHDFQIPIGSLPSILRPDAESFANAQKPYLHGNQEIAGRLRRQILGDKKAKIIGLSWHTDSNIQSAHHRNIRLSEIAQTFMGSDAIFVSLQYGQVSKEICSINSSKYIDLREVPEIDKKLDISGLSSLMLACDYVLCIDNSVVHLAGALGVNTKLLLPTIHDCRWGINQKTTVWYDSVELFHKPSTNDWKTTLTEVKSKIS